MIEQQGGREGGPRLPHELAGANFGLDHLTVVDATPSELAKVAEATGFSAVCLFMESMAALPRMPQFSLYDSPEAKRELRTILEGSGVRLDVAYPFTLSRRSEPDDFRRGLECAAFLGARFANALVYDREPERRLEQFASFCALADEFELGAVLEFFPGSAVRSLAEGLDLVTSVQRRHEVGLNVDLLHLMRSGGSVQELCAAPPDYILFGQLCDGLLECDVASRDHEASMQRLLPGRGEFDVKGFHDALPTHCPVSLEIPQESSIRAGASLHSRARTALDAARCTLEG